MGRIHLPPKLLELTDALAELGPGLSPAPAAHLHPRTPLSPSRSPKTIPRSQVRLRRPFALEPQTSINKCCSAFQGRRKQTLVSFFTLIFLSSDLKQAEKPQMWWAEAAAPTEVSEILTKISDDQRSLSSVTVSGSTFHVYFKEKLTGCRETRSRRGGLEAKLQLLPK